MIYGDHHPYGLRHEGTEDTIKGITKDDLETFVKTRFSKSQLVVGVCGKLTQDQVKDIVDNLFGDFPQESTFPIIPKNQPEIKGEKKEISWDVPQTIVKFASMNISPKDPDFYAASILFTLLGGGFKSRLMEEVRVKRGLTYGIRVSPSNSQLADILMGDFSASAKNVSQAIDVIKSIWKDLKEKGPLEEEVEKAKNYLMNSYILGFSETKQVSSQLVIAQILERDSDYFNKRNDIIKAVTTEQVKNVAARLLNPEAISFVIVGKKEQVTAQ
jgi:zinc protease